MATDPVTEVYKSLQASVHDHAILCDEMRRIATFFAEDAIEFTSLVSTIKQMLAEMKRTILLFPDRRTFETEFREFTKAENADDSLFSVSISDKDVDVYKLYIEVMARGGFHRVTRELEWEEVWCVLDGAYTNNSDSYSEEGYRPPTTEEWQQLMEYYKQYLFPFELSRRQLLDAMPIDSDQCSNEIIDSQGPPSPT